MIPSHGQILKLTHSNAIFASWYKHYVTEWVWACSYLLSCRRKNISRHDFNSVLKTALVSQQQSLIARMFPVLLLLPHSNCPRLAGSHALFRFLRPKKNAIRQKMNEWRQRPPITKQINRSPALSERKQVWSSIWTTWLYSLVKPVWGRHSYSEGSKR